MVSSLGLLFVNCVLYFLLFCRSLYLCNWLVNVLWIVCDSSMKLMLLVVVFGLCFDW